MRRLGVFSWAGRYNHPMPRVPSSTTRAVFAVIELEGYRCGLGELDGVFYATAKRDKDGQFHSAKASTEGEAVAGLAELVGVDLADG